MFKDMKIENERKLFENSLKDKSVLRYVEFSKILNSYVVKEEFFDIYSIEMGTDKLNFGWQMWQASVSREEC